MIAQQQLNYERIAQAITYLKANFKQQPSLEELANQVHLSPFHFQRLFQEWAGIIPKKFLHYISLNHAKNLLRNQQGTISDAALDTGLSSTSRLHDLFVNIEGMTPAEYKNGGQHLQIEYGFFVCHFGQLIVASTAKGVCYMTFYEDETIAVQLLKNQFPNARLEHKKNELQQSATSIFNKDWGLLPNIKLHLKGTEFQLKVWETLLKIPMGQLSTYGDIAAQIKNPAASRAVGTAIGSNPVAYIIPCHRVIRASGALGGYMWGEIRKLAIIGWESAQVTTKHEDEIEELY